MLKLIKYLCVLLTKSSSSYAAITNCNIKTSFTIIDKYEYLSFHRIWSILYFIHYMHTYIKALAETDTSICSEHVTFSAVTTVYSN